MHTVYHVPRPHSRGRCQEQWTRRWGVPGLVTLTTLAIHLLQPPSITNPGFGRDTCFFSTYLARLLYLHGIIALILVINLGFFLASAYSLLFGLWSSSNGADSSGRFARTR